MAAIMENQNQMDSVAGVYKGGFFKSRHRLSWRAPIIVGALIKTFALSQLATIVDIGCAIGDYVAEFNKRGYQSYGLEGSEAAKPFFVSPNISVWDIREPLLFDADYSLAISLEVAEHIELEYATTYTQNLTRLSDTILITAAPPGQKGHGHVNCQEKGWWEAEFKNFGYLREIALEDSFKANLVKWKHRKEVNVYANNVLVFQNLKSKRIK